MSDVPDNLYVQQFDNVVDLRPPGPQSTNVQCTVCGSEYWTLQRLEHDLPGAVILSEAVGPPHLRVVGWIGEFVCYECGHVR